MQFLDNLAMKPPPVASPEIRTRKAEIRDQNPKPETNLPHPATGKMLSATPTLVQLCLRGCRITDSTWEVLCRDGLERNKSVPPSTLDLGISSFFGFAMPVYGFRVSCFVFRSGSGTGSKGGTDAGEVARIDGLERNKSAPHALSTIATLNSRTTT